MSVRTRTHHGRKQNKTDAVKRLSQDERPVFSSPHIFHQLFFLHLFCLQLRFLQLLLLQPLHEQAPQAQFSLFGEQRGPKMAKIQYGVKPDISKYAHPSWCHRSQSQLTVSVRRLCVSKTTRSSGVQQTLAPNLTNWVFSVIRPNPILHFAPFLSTHFFPCLNPIFKNGSFLSVVALCL